MKNNQATMKEDEGEPERLFVIRGLSLIRHSGSVILLAMDLVLVVAGPAVIERAKDIGRSPLPLTCPPE